MPKDKVIVIRVSAAKKAALEEQAKAAGISLSAWLIDREAVVASAPKPVVAPAPIQTKPVESNPTWRRQVQPGSLLKGTKPAKSTIVKAVES